MSRSKKLTQKEIYPVILIVQEYHDLFLGRG